VLTLNAYTVELEAVAAVKRSELSITGFILKPDGSGN
jgi:hypothetical protein